MKDFKERKDLKPELKADANKQGTYNPQQNKTQQPLKGGQNIDKNRQQGGDINNKNRGGTGTGATNSGKVDFNKNKTDWK